MSHANAFLTPKGRLRLARCVVDQGWPLRRAAERFQCSPTTAKKWADRYRIGGVGGDGSIAPVARTSVRTEPRRRSERRIINLRFTRRWGPHRIAYHLHLSRSTVQAVLRRYRMPLLRHLDHNTGLAVRRPRPHRYEHPAPGDLVHLDIKKLGRIPDGGGHRKLGTHDRQPAQQKARAAAMPTCITPSMTTPGWLTQRSSTMNVKRRPPRSGNGPTQHLRRSRHRRQASTD